ncbi:hypothetical protein CEUSTIGMA_g8687.t1 [Chlamydomonas eustigma]|uniref:Uncharacterized protein n=1 Tax=Chlamydomonas eustigma TaxID=1157962 RepID=A0A250XDU6_9CHLO|nr:hypothetical protein CEUSTIGMA_g8687.t1 [Chlamydomonas eustigma]|eukprot:GAX81255.1 hypothetical protein CEUSTIGMA_g8687.t1 [Chlamydomonas eustigma]
MLHRAPASRRVFSAIPMGSGSAPIGAWTTPENVLSDGSRRTTVQSLALKAISSLPLPSLSGPVDHLLTESSSCFSPLPHYPTLSEVGSSQGLSLNSSTESSKSLVRYPVGSNSMALSNMKHQRIDSAGIKHDKSAVHNSSKLDPQKLAGLLGNLQMRERGSGMQYQQVPPPPRTQPSAAMAAPSYKQLHQVNVGSTWSTVSPQATYISTQPVPTTLLTPQYSPSVITGHSLLTQQAQAVDLTHPLLAGALQAGVLPQVLAQLTPQQLELLSQQQPQMRSLVSVNEGMGSGDVVWTQNRQASGASGLGVSMTPGTLVPQHVLLQQHQQQQQQPQQVLILQQHQEKPQHQQQWSLKVGIPLTQTVMPAPSLSYHVLQHDQMPGTW